MDFTFREINASTHPGAIQWPNASRGKFGRDDLDKLLLRLDAQIARAGAAWPDASSQLARKAATMPAVLPRLGSRMGFAIYLTSK